MISRSNCALCGAPHNAHYAECGIMQSHRAEVAVWPAFQRRGTPHNPSSKNEVIGGVQRARRDLARSGRGGWFQDSRFSAPRSQGKRASRMAMLSAVVARGAGHGGTASRGITRSARRARWLRPHALPPRAPRRRCCSGDVLKVYTRSAMVSLRTPHSLALVGNTSKSKIAFRSPITIHEKAVRQSYPTQLIARSLGRDYAESSVTEMHAKLPLRCCSFA